MSKISTIHDAIITKIEANLTSYTRLANPYELELNPKTLLRKGYGVAISAGARSNRVVGCQVSYSRDFNISLINEILTTDDNRALKETAAKDLMEDHFTLLSKFEIDGGLSGVAIDGIVIADSGIQFVELDTATYYLIEIEISVEYLEDLTAI